MKVIQILPELDSGGVERGTLELGNHLTKLGHQSLVVSNGGRLVPTLEKEGSRHIRLPVHRKHPKSLVQIYRLRRLLLEEKPDILHTRSRLPAWLAWLAWLSLSSKNRPRLVTTVHGFYSVNAYSAVMTRGEAVITVSESVRAYVQKNYPKTRFDKLTVIHRGVDEVKYSADFTPSAEWRQIWKDSHPELEGKITLLMPGRLTRWKGQEDFLRLIKRLFDRGLPVHGLIAGEPHAKKAGFLTELQELALSLGISERVTFLGYRSDLREIMASSALIYSLSRDPEAFGRVSLEALALGKPVIGYNHGGVAEQLEVIFPQGLIAPGDEDAAFHRSIEILESGSIPASIGSFTLKRMLESTVGVYEGLLGSSRY